MINVNELKRNAKNIVKKYSDAQVKVREATSNDPWGPSSTIMAEIADLTYNVVAFSEIMQMIWKRLNDHGKNWRHVFKSLVLLEYLAKTGTEKVAQQCIENIFAIQTLKDFQYIEDNKDHGSSIREKSKKLVALFKDPERLKAERARALKAKSRLVEAVSSSGQSSFGSSISRSSNFSGDTGNSTSNNSISNNNNNNNNNNNSNSGIPSSNNSSSSNNIIINNNNNNNYQLAEADSSSALGDLDSARPHSLTEEETQLQIALALSKEEAERQEKTRKNDELRLKLALDVSKQAAGNASGGSDFMDDFSESSASLTSGPSQTQHLSSSSKPSKRSNIDDLLGLSLEPTEVAPAQPPEPQSQPQPQPQMSTISNGLFSPAAATPSSIASRLEPQNDPWSVDPWQSRQPELLLNSRVISSQPSIVPGSSEFPTTAPLATTLPSATQPANATTAVVPNQFPISNIDSIFSTSKPKKTISKNPFED